MSKENFVKNVNLFLKEKQWSRNRLAKELNCDSSTVSKWLNLNKEPSLDYIFKLLSVFDCTFEELFS